MSLTSLNRFSVPTAGAGSNTSLLMPKLKYRFRVSLLGFGVDYFNHIMDDWGYLGEGVFEFRNEKDYMWFMLRWQ